MHYGHIRLLERAKALGDYLVVGVTSDDFDKTRGKINVQQSLAERVEAVRATGLADLIIVEEYEGQKIDDIKRYGIDIFTLGSDWKGKFDYLKEYCEVIYLDRTEGVSSTQIRSENNSINMGIVGDSAGYFSKVYKESLFVNGVTITGICTNNIKEMCKEIKKLPLITTNYLELLESVDVVYIKSLQEEHYEQIKLALNKGKSVLCESPIALEEEKCNELFELAKKKNCILMEAIRTAYSMAYYRLLLLLKGGKIGDILSIDVTCTSMQPYGKTKSMLDWGSNVLLPIFQILGTNYKQKRMFTRYIDEEKKQDGFTQIQFLYDHAVATGKMAEGAKSEGELIITGTKGYIYVPAPWWKTDYFEARYENQSLNKRYFYQLDGEGIRYELVAFAKDVANKNNKNIYIDKEVSLAISRIMEDFKQKTDLVEI